MTEPKSLEAVAIRGIDPAVAFLVPDEDPTLVFAAGSPDRAELPAEVKELLSADRD